MLHNGIEDYLEIMQIAGVSELKKTANNLKPVAENKSRPTPNPAEEKKHVTPSQKTEEPKSLPPVKKKESVLQNTEIPLLPPVPEGLSKAEQLHWLADETAQCTRCAELARFRTQTVFGTGKPDAELVFLGEAPGAEEDKQGEPFVGRAGLLLTDIIEKGMKMRREDVYICNILRCRPPGNRNPMPDEAACCRQFLNQTLKIIEPKFICCLGAVAAKNLLRSELTIGALRGKMFEYEGIKVICTYHPAYLLRTPSAKKETWADIQFLLREMGRG